MPLKRVLSWQRRLCLLRASENALMRYYLDRFIDAVGRETSDLIQHHSAKVEELPSVAA